MRILAILLFALTASAQGLWTRWEAGPVEVVAEAGVNGPALLAELQGMGGCFSRKRVFQSEAEYRRYAGARSATKIG